MKEVVAALRPTPIRWRRASALASPTEVPASTLPARGMAPLRANIASRSVVLPLWKGPTSAMHRGPQGLLTSCPSAASSSGARPLIGSAGGWSSRPHDLARWKNVAAVHREKRRTDDDATCPERVPWPSGWVSPSLSSAGPKAGPAGPTHPKGWIRTAADLDNIWLDAINNLFIQCGYTGTGDESNIGTGA